jgi:hypothetical protein
MLNSHNDATELSRQRLRSALPLLALVAFSACCFAFRRQDDAQGLVSCQSNLKQYSLGLLMYCQDYDECFPPMKFASQVHPRVMPYIKNDAIFSCPVTAKPYLPNPAMNYVNVGQIKSPATMLMLRDATPHTPDGGQPTWNVAYLDGHVKPLTTEPTLGKPAPTPLPLTHAQLVRAELKRLIEERRGFDARMRQQRRALDARIRQLEKEEQRLQGTHG